MGEPAASVSGTVEYTMDKWLMDRVPWAMWVCVAGAAVVLHAQSQGGNGAALAIVYLGLLALAFAGWALTTLIGRSGISILVELPIHLLIVAVVVVLTGGILMMAGQSDKGSIRSYGRAWWSDMVNPPFNVFGWMLIFLGLGWIAFAAWRHRYPGRPVLMLSPQGILFHRSWLKDLVIPWREVHGAGLLDISEIKGYAATNPNVAAVIVSRQFYDSTIAPKVSFFAPPGTEFMFRPKGAMIQVALNSTEVAVDPKDYVGPIAERWKAYKDIPAPAPVAHEPIGPRVVYGRWSIDGSWWQTIQFLAPLAALTAVVLHARG